MYFCRYSWMPARFRSLGSRMIASDAAFNVDVDVVMTLTTMPGRPASLSSSAN